MNIYTTIYNNLCETRKSQKQHYTFGSNIHCHHIIPKHCNGSDDDDNLTYLTIREHIIAHFLLWKIYRNPNDLRSMKMLGANLTSQQRSLIGKFCYENKIGIHSEKYKSNTKANIDRTKKSAKTQSKNKVGTFDPEFRKIMASKGGKAGSKTQREKQIGAFFDPILKKKIATLGGKALSGLIAVTNGKHRTRISPEKLDEYLKNGYVRGFKLF